MEPLLTGWLRSVALVLCALQGFKYFILNQLKLNDPIVYLMLFLSVCIIDYKSCNCLVDFRFTISAECQFQVIRGKNRPNN